MGQMKLDWDGNLEEGKETLVPADLGYSIFSTFRYKEYLKALEDWECGYGFYHSPSVKMTPYLGERAYYKIEDGVFYVIYRGMEGKRRDKYRTITIPVGSTKEEHIRTLLSDLRLLNGELSKDVYLRMTENEIKLIPETSKKPFLYRSKHSVRLDEHIVDTDFIVKSRQIRRRVRKFTSEHGDYEIVNINYDNLSLLDRLLRDWHDARYHVHYGSVSLTMDKQTFRHVLDTKQKNGLFTVIIDGNPIGVCGVIHLKHDWCAQPVLKYSSGYTGISDFMNVYCIQRAKELGYKWLNCADTPSGVGLQKFKQKYSEKILKMNKITYNRSSYGDSRWIKKN